MKKYKGYYFAALVLMNIGVAVLSTAQSTSKKLKDIELALPVLDKLYKDFAEKNHLPSLVYGVVTGGKLVHTGSTGFADLDKKIIASPQSAFRIASMTKSFTAMAILQLRDKALLTLDDPVYKYIPEMNGQHYLTNDATPVTIRHLLCHAAGFPEDNPWGDRQLAVSDEEMLKMIKKGISFSTIPGTAYEYSNMGFAMLGYIIKKVSGQRYQEYIKDSIWAPLGMHHTYWDYNDVPANQLAFGYRWLNATWAIQPLLKDGAYGAMGGMITTMEDFSKYTALHLSAWPPGNAVESGPVKRASLREMQHPWNIPSLNAQYKYPGGRACAIISAYSFGLGYTMDCEGRVKVGHSGGLPGYGSNWSMLPGYDIGIISFSNLTYAPAGYINTLALDTLISMAKLQPRAVPVSAVLNQRKEALLKLLPNWENAESSGIFAENFFLDYFIEPLKNEATAIFNRAGKIMRIKEMVADNNLRGSFGIECEKANIEVSFTLTPEDPPLIQEYKIRLMEKK